VIKSILKISITLTEQKLIIVNEVFEQFHM